MSLYHIPLYTFEKVITKRRENLAPQQLKLRESNFGSYFVITFLKGG